MVALDKRAMPKEIAPANLCELNGETAYWYCPTCRKWRTSLVTAEGITCCVCGDAPDWEKQPPTLAYRSRFQRVLDLCTEGSEWREECDDIEQQYGDFIEQNYAGVPARTKDIGWRYFSNAWKAIDSVADYLLTAQDTPVVDAPHAYTEQGLQRRYSDSRRKCNVSSLSGLNLNPAVDDSGIRLTNQETVEIMSFHTANSQQFYDTYFPNEFLSAVHDPLERSIARDLSEGASKRDVERKYGLTERRVRTIVSHIAKSLNRR